MAKRFSDEDRQGQLAYFCCDTVILTKAEWSQDRLVCPYCTLLLVEPVELVITSKVNK